jgi:hypothetical protein
MCSSGIENPNAFVMFPRERNTEIISLKRWNEISKPLKVEM